MFKDKEIIKNIKILSKYKNFMLVVINNEMNKLKKNETDATLRYYGLGAQIIKDFKVRSMILLSRSKKIIGLEGFGLKNKKTSYYKMKKILIINANYYDNVTKKLVISSKNILKKEKFKLSIIEIPGVFEIPITIRRNIKRFDAFIALGCVIKGETPHFNLICKSTFDAILKLSITYNKPIGNGVITALNMQQAKERCGLLKSKKPNKGLEAAKAVLSILKNGSKKI